MLEGYVHPDFSDVARVLRNQLPTGRRRPRPGGTAACVWHRGEVVVDCWGGTRDEEGLPWRSDTVAFSYSTTKGVTSTLLHVLAEKGLVDYDAPVCEYWPEFAANGKAGITVRHVLCHEAGLYHIRHMIEDARDMLDWDHMVRALEQADPRHAPGEAHGYHAFTYGWLVGEIVQRVTGKPFREVLATELAAPLELDGLFIGLPADQLHRRARLIPVRRRRERPSDVLYRQAARLTRGLRAARIHFDPQEAVTALMPPGIEHLDFNDKACATASLPAANGTFTARSLARLYAMLAGGGEVDGVRLLSPERVEALREPQNRGIGRVIPYSMQWRLGYHRVNTIRAKVPRGMGHAGFGGSGGWADPERQLAVALVLNSGTGTPFGDLRIIRVSDAAVRCADRR